MQHCQTAGACRLGGNIFLILVAAGLDPHDVMGARSVVVIAQFNYFHDRGTSICYSNSNSVTVIYQKSAAHFFFSFLKNLNEIGLSKKKKYVMSIRGRLKSDCFHCIHLLPGHR